MRLLKCEDLTLHEFFEDEVPPYAILSHTWGREEVKYQEMLSPTEEVKRRSGYRKILTCAKQSLELGYKWVGLILGASTSRAVLSFQKRSTRCTPGTDMRLFVSRISQISSTKNVIHITYYTSSEDVIRETAHLLGSSRWFTRGCTLQELIAPKPLILVNSDWE